MNFLDFFIHIIFSLMFYIVLVSTVGLKEEFTWSRINFEWPLEGELTSRFAYGLSKGSKRYFGNSAGNSILFEEATNERLIGVGGKTSNKNNVSGISASESPGSIDYQYVNNIPIGLNVWKDKLFISVPRRRPGIPSTLNYISLNSKEKHNVPLKPYPNWDINLYPDTSGKGENLISVYRFAIDPCDRMWLVDTGILEIPGNRTYIRPQHQLVVINLQSDQIIHRYNLPDRVITPATALTSVTVDVTKQTCDNAYVYFPDLAGYGVVVYSLRENHAWRVTHNYFLLEPNKGNFFVAGHRFQWKDGVFSIELTDVKSDGYRDMYFHSMAGTQQYRVSTRIMRNETLATRNNHQNDFQIVGDRGPNTQTTSADIHKSTGIMFLGLVNLNALGCWNINKPLSTLSIVQKDDNKMIYPSDLRVVGDKVYIFTNTMPEFLYGRLNYDQINFRVWSNDINSAIEGTMCQSMRSGKSHY